MDNNLFEALKYVQKGDSILKKIPDSELKELSELITKVDKKIEELKKKYILNEY